MRGDRFETRTQPQVKRVAENDLRVNFVEFARLDRLHRAVGADRHEDRRFDDAVIERQTAAARLAVGVEQLELEAVVGAVVGALRRVIAVAGVCSIMMTVGHAGLLCHRKTVRRR